MRAFTEQRDAGTPDELWLCEHDPVYTQGIAGRSEHVLSPEGIPVVRTNRGGQVTYHGPGQVVAYPLVDLRRLGIYVKEYVFRLEQAVLKTLADYGVTGHRVAGAPGIYVKLADPFGHAMLAAPAAGAVTVPPISTSSAAASARARRVSSAATTSASRSAARRRGEASSGSAMTRSSTSAASR